jgi:hypothetical protein
MISPGPAGQQDHQSSCESAGWQLLAQPAGRCRCRPGRGETGAKMHHVGSWAPAGCYTMEYTAVPDEVEVDEVTAENGVERMSWAGKPGFHVVVLVLAWHVAVWLPATWASQSLLCCTPIPTHSYRPLHIPADHC